MEVCFTLKRPCTANFKSEQLAAVGSCRYRPLPAQTNRGSRPSAAAQAEAAEVSNLEKAARQARISNCNLLPHSSRSRSASIAELTPLLVYGQKWRPSTRFSAATPTPKGG